MANEKNIRFEYHLKLNKRNPRHVKSALVLASVEKQYKSSFIALAIEHYMKTHPLGVSMDELLDMYRQSDRSYQPKAPIIENLLNRGARQPAEALAGLPAVSLAPEARDGAETRDAIDKAMNFYDIS